MTINVLLFLLGTCLGSFFCVVAQRWPQDKSILTPASHCTSCGEFLKWRDLIPLVSALRLRFRCRYCHKHFSYSSFAAEFLCGTLFLLSFPLTFTGAASLNFFWLTAAFLLALADCFYLILEPKIFYPSLVILWGGKLGLGQLFHWETLLYCSGILLFLTLFLRGRFGAGDVLLLLSWSPWLELRQFCLLLILASGTGLVAYGFFQLSAVTTQPLAKKELPFIPFLAVGLWLVLQFNW
ncbi:prepilin peptidase [Candidatus Enterococcus leclercqii]|uniref:prepilin peptidase n=1 Tax=Candidatus Enterococcus leclercqii TaxID=1857218 RepID=UPI00137A1104|nr:A24 family peptidase [Enterococcus sp. CU9D]KAF1293527.1 hypothetical protein BAU14_02105 [Enterococcus sp. CU9D]